MPKRALLQHEVTGADRKLGLLLLHPLGANLRFWDDCVAAVGGDFSTVAVDLRNSIDNAPVTIAQHVEDLTDLGDHLGFQRLVVVGCAISTMIAAGFAAAAPERTAALVLTNATPRSSAKASAMLSERGTIVRREGIAAVLPGAVERAFLNQPHDARYRRYYEAFASQSAEDYAFACEASAHYDAGYALPAIRCPTLVIAGADDVLLPPALSEEVAAAIAGAELVTMPAVAHFVPYQAPAAFVELVKGFLRRVGA